MTDRRLHGYREAFRSVGVEIGDDRVVLGPASIAGGSNALAGVWATGLRPTAVLAMSDAMAIGAMHALRDLGLDVPGDVSVVGFDDIDLASHVEPPLTTVHQPIRQKGEEAVRLLLAVVGGEGRRDGRSSPARDAAHRPRLERPGPTAAMTVDTPDWVRDAIFYQIFPDRFAGSERVHKPGTLEPWDAPPTVNGFKGGDLRGITEHLDYLEDLGITAIYLTPIFSSGSNHRYHTYDYFEVDPLLGGDDALRELLDAAHGRGMRVVLDGVFNHTGRGFFPFHHLMETGASSPYRHWFHTDARLDAGRPLQAYPPAGTAPSEFGYKAWWNLPALPKLNTGNPEVREFLMTVAEYWLRFGIDGWRLDVPAEIDDEAFWQEFRRRCRAIRPDAYLVGEIWRVAPEWLRGDRFDALMNYPLGEAILGFAGGSHLDMGIVTTHHEYRLWVRPLDGPAFADRVVELANAYDPDVVAVQLNVVGSHDAPRLRTVLGGDARRAPPGDAPPGDAPRRPLDLLRRRGRADGRARSGLPRRVPMGRGPLGAGPARFRSGAPAPAPRRARAARRAASRGGRRRFGRCLRARRGSVALRRGGQPRGRSRPARHPPRGPGRWRWAPRTGRAPRSRRHHGRPHRGRPRDARPSGALRFRPAHPLRTGGDFGHTPRLWQISRSNSGTG